MVRFQPPQLEEVNRPDEEPVLKTGGPDEIGIVGSSPTASAETGSWSNRKTPAPHAGDSGAIPDGSTFQNDTIPWSSGDDAWFTSKKRWFKSIRDHLFGAQVRQRLSGSA